MTPPASIHPTAYIAPGANVASSATIGPFCTIGPAVTIADGVKLVSHVSVSGRTSIDNGTIVHPFTALGGSPQHVAYKGEDTALIIGKNNIIREHVTMNIGTQAGRGQTTVGNDGFFMAGAHIAHDCRVGDNVIFANNATLGGHVIVENNVFLGGLSAVHQFCQIGAFAFIGGCAAVIHDVIPYGSANGNYANLEGLNIIGMKRQNMDRDVINKVRSLYRHLFTQAGPFQERLAGVPKEFSDGGPAHHILSFINRDRKRPLMMP